MVNVLIAEDEPILLNSLVAKIEKYWPQASIVSQCQSGEDALEAIMAYNVDVAFLDIQMGELSGIDVALRANKHCHFVFVTAYDQYAVTAFETGAIDYLLKPYSDTRLQDCINRVQQRLNLPPADISKVLNGLQQESRNFLKRLKIQIGNRIWLVPMHDVLYFQASGRYIKVVTAEREALLRMPLKTLMTQLDPDDFWQIHRSMTININYLDHVSTKDPEQLAVYLKGYATALPVSRSFQHLFRTTSAEV